jgi:hypothetical protein
MRRHPAATPTEEPLESPLINRAMFPRYLLLFIVTVACCSVSSPAQEADGFGEADKLAIEKMYERYAQAFIKKDYAALRRMRPGSVCLFARTGDDARIRRCRNNVLSKPTRVSVKAELRSQRHSQHTHHPTHGG